MHYNLFNLTPVYFADFPTDVDRNAPWKIVLSEVFKIEQVGVEVPGSSALIEGVYTTSTQSCRLNLKKLAVPDLYDIQAFNRILINNLDLRPALISPPEVDYPPNESLLEQPAHFRLEGPHAGFGSIQYHRTRTYLGGLNRHFGECIGAFVMDGRQIGSLYQSREPGSADFEEQLLAQLRDKQFFGYALRDVRRE